MEAGKLPGFRLNERAVPILTNKPSIQFIRKWCVKEPPAAAGGDVFRVTVVPSAGVPRLWLSLLIFKQHWAPRWAETQLYQPWTRGEDAATRLAGEHSAAGPATGSNPGGVDQLSYICTSFQKFQFPTWKSKNAYLSISIKHTSPSHLCCGGPPSLLASYPLISGFCGENNGCVLIRCPGPGPGLTSHTAAAVLSVSVVCPVIYDHWRYLLFILIM